MALSMARVLIATTYVQGGSKGAVISIRLRGRCQLEHTLLIHSYKPLAPRQGDPGQPHKAQ